MSATTSQPSVLSPAEAPPPAAGKSASAVTLKVALATKNLADDVGGSAWTARISTCFPHAKPWLPGRVTVRSKPPFRTATVASVTI